MAHHDHDSDADVAELAAEIERLRTELARMHLLRRPIELEGRLVQDDYSDVDGTIGIRGRITTADGVWHCEQFERRNPAADRWVSVLFWPDHANGVTGAD